VSYTLRHKEIVPNIRFTPPNPKVDFVGGKMRVQTELEKVTLEMAARDGKWLTSISSYGVGGAHAHIVLESIDSVHGFGMQPQARITMVQSLLCLFSIGTLTESSLGRWKDVLWARFDGTTDDRTLWSVARDLDRQAHAYPARAFAVAPSLGKDTKFPKPALSTSNASPKLALVFSSQSPQHIFTGRQLAASHPAFLAAVQENDRVLVERHGQESMLERTGLFVPE
jgi:acyl transferase domain-containing protein